jgi:hypothetical protein
MDKVFVHCPACGKGFTHENVSNGKSIGLFGGAAAGATVGAKIGLFLGPIGAIGGTIPGAILGGVFGKNYGKKFDRPRCPNCGTNFQLPESLE